MLHNVMTANFLSLEKKWYTAIVAKTESQKFSLMFKTKEILAEFYESI